MGVRFLCRNCGENVEGPRFGECPNCSRLEARHEARTAVRPTLLSLAMAASSLAVLAAVVAVLFLLGQLGEGAAVPFVSFLAYGVVSAVLARGLYRNRAWTRVLLMVWVAFPSMLLAALALQSGVVPSTLVVIATGGPTVGVLGFLGWYLFSKRDVVAYYAVLKQAGVGFDAPI